MRTLPRIVFLIGGVVLAVKSVFLFAGIALTIWRQAYSGDALIFLSIGRGLAQGLTAYVDIFENKPPGIFLLSALADMAGNGLWLSRFAEILAILGLPVLAVIAARAPVAGESRNERHLRTLFLGGFGIVLSLLSAHWGVGYYTETFAAFFGCAFVAAITHIDLRPRTAIICGGIALALSGLFKEPAAGAAVGAALILSATPRAFLRILLTFCVAVPFALLLMAVTGTLVPYITIELPYMLQWHVVLASLMSNMNEVRPVWKDALAIHRTAANLLRANIGVALIAAATCVAVVRDAALERDRLLRGWRLICVVLAIILATLAAQSGGDSGHRQVTMLPVLLALMIMACNTLPNLSPYVRRMWMTTCGAAIALAIVLFPAWHAPDQREMPHANDLLLAQTFDAMLDACHVDRYLLMSALQEQLHGYTQHLPLPAGPLSIRMDQRMQIPPLQTMISDSLAQAKIIVMQRGESVYEGTYQHIEPIIQYLAHHFTDDVPPCAKVFVFPEHIMVLYRID